MRILVTGGAGFIGSNLVKLLISNHHEVKVFDNLSTGSQENIKDLPCDFILGDILDFEEINKACANTEIVFHLAASVGRQRSIDSPIVDANINLIGTINLLEAMRLNNIEKIVYSSSAAIYGELLEEVIDESHALNPDSPYGVTKLAAEKMIFAYADMYNFVAVSLRYFNIYGIGQKYDTYGNVIPIFVNNILNNIPVRIFGDGEQTRDFLNVKDVAKANMLAMECTESNVFNLGSGKSITINTLVKIIEKICKNVKVIYMPKRPGDVLNCKANIEKSFNYLKFTPQTDLENGLLEYIQWFKNKNNNS